MQRAPQKGSVSWHLVLIIQNQEILMKILNADTLRDGGTTCVSFDDGNSVRHVTFDHSLARDDRIRYVYISDREFGQDDTECLVPNSDEEIRVIEAIRAAAAEEYNSETVENFYKEPNKNPGEGIWFYVFNFLWIAIKERNAS